MKLLAFAIRDKQVDAFMPVFFVRAKGEAMRHFIDVCADGKSPMSKHPGDYDLYELFEFDDVTGSVHPGGSGDAELIRILTGLEAVSIASAGSK